VVAVTQGEDVVVHTVERLRRARDFLVRQLGTLPGVEVAIPAGAMYAFFRVDGMGDSLDFCKRLVADQGLGLAPGVAFGPESEGFIRWCFAASEERLADGVQRLERALHR
jgi:aspartate/methionine/tyrosine aminotransferase